VDPVPTFHPPSVFHSLSLSKNRWTEWSKDTAENIGIYVEGRRITFNPDLNQGVILIVGRWKWDPSHHRHHLLIESTPMAATKGREETNINVNVRQGLNDETALATVSRQRRRKMPSSTQHSIPPAIPPGSGPPELLPIKQGRPLPSSSMRLALPDLALRFWSRIGGRLYTIQTLWLMTPGRTCSTPIR